MFGFYDDDRAIVYINSSMTPAERRILVAHEVAHAMGLLHVAPEERPSIMNNGNKTREPNTRDAAAIADLWGQCAKDGATVAAN